MILYIAAIAAVVALSLFAQALMPFLILGGAALIGVRMYRMKAQHNYTWDSEELHHPGAHGLMLAAMGAMCFISGLGFWMLLVGGLSSLPAYVYTIRDLTDR